MASLTATEMQRIAKVEKREGMQRLSEHFQWNEFVGDSQRQLLHQEFVYEVAMFAVNRGFPWTATSEVARMSKELLPNLKGLERDQAIELTAERVSQCLPSLPEVHHATMFNFIAETYVHHQQLYQAFMSLPAPKNPVVQLKVEVPPVPPQLSEGMDIKEWETQNAVRRLASAQEEKLAEIRQLRQQAGRLQQEQLEATLECFGREGSRGKQEVEKIIHDIVKAQGEKIMETMMKESALIQELLELKIQMKAMARPEPVVLSSHQKTKK
ncbi:hypothetical protein AALO_G00246880 [Alosa alosa]|uniref:Uncharacterized protein n=1 Tax=Alosa alosa TaxID=278164 RepID=A0AAV6FSK0_9TELE|nr:uncharacterized protein C8orf74 homolog [Alosa sapidissima]XP_048083626.1 uncharacterized protein C8orf74 homolog [Alosa alosa]KAG5265833.1 hypothetical protein AALO_G00246880 [Alosa alosa]